MLKRILAISLVLIMIIALVGCGKGRRKIVELTLSTEDSEAILAAAGIKLPAVEQTPAAGTTVRWYAWYDNFHNYNDDEVVNTGYFTFREKYGCEVEYVETTWDDRYTQLANYMVAGTPPDMYPGDYDTFPFYAAVQKMFQPVDDYLDYSDPLWEGVRDYADTYFCINGKHYMMLTDISINNVVAYNRRVFQEYGYDDPAELYRNDEWTSEEFLNMCVDFSDPDADRYALDGWYYDTALMDMSGVSIVSYNPETGLFESNVDNPGLERAADFVNELKKNECIFPVWNNGWKLRGGVEVQGTGIKEGLCLMFVVGTWGFSSGSAAEIDNVWGNVAEGELMFCPLPRDVAGDGKYYTSSRSGGYCLIRGATNPEGVALLASCDRFKIIDPTVVDIDKKQLREVYHWSDEMLEMYDECHDLANSDTALLYYEEASALIFTRYVRTSLNLEERPMQPLGRRLRRRPLRDCSTMSMRLTYR